MNVERLYKSYEKIVYRFGKTERKTNTVIFISAVKMLKMFTPNHFKNKINPNKKNLKLVLSIS